MVAEGDGELVIQRSSRQTCEAAVSENYFGGKSKQSRLEIREGTLRLPLRERDEDGTFLEWIELNFRGRWRGAPLGVRVLTSAEEGPRQARGVYVY